MKTVEIELENQARRFNLGIESVSTVRLLFDILESDPRQVGSDNE